MKRLDAKNLKRRQTKARGRESLEKEIDQLAAALVEVSEEIELVSKEGSTLEDIEGTKALAADVLERYSALMKRLSRDDWSKLQESLEPVFHRIKSGLTQLKEAPE